MQIIEFNAKIKNGMIKIPRQYTDKLQENVKVILQQEEQTVVADKIDQLIRNIHPVNGYEICINLIRKAGMKENEIQELIKSFYFKYQVLSLNESVLTVASQVRSQYSISFRDSMIISSALNAGCNILYSEDMQHNLVVSKTLKSINPFA